VIRGFVLIIIIGNLIVIAKKIVVQAAEIVIGIVKMHILQNVRVIAYHVTYAVKRERVACLTVIVK